MYLIALLVSLTSSPVDVRDMGSADYRTRERASRRAEFYAPLNHLMLARGALSSDPETRRRCKAALAVSQRRLEPIRTAGNYLMAANLIYGGGTWQLSDRQRRAVLEGGYPLHHAMAVIAQRAGLLKHVNSNSESGWEDTAPCEANHGQFGGSIVDGYQPVEMVEFANLMRRRVRGLPDVP